MGTPKTMALTPRNPKNIGIATLGALRAPCCVDSPFRPNMCFSCTEYAPIKAGKGTNEITHSHVEHIPICDVYDSLSRINVCFSCTEYAPIKARKGKNQISHSHVEHVAMCDVCDSLSRLNVCFNCTEYAPMKAAQGKNKMTH